MGRYVDHLKNWWLYKDSPNMYTLYYEKMKSNPNTEIRNLASFFGYNLTDEQIENVRNAYINILLTYTLYFYIIYH